MVYLTRLEHFNAAHKLYNDTGLLMDLNQRSKMNNE